ncbi:unnamed protein product [Ectocarpus sp. CCAP 1310/34]|nr:unnamed protein product [Ectocarpus sp. CCAP 1310/34]
MIIMLGRHQLEVIDVSSTDAEAKAVEGDRIPFAVGDKGSNATSPSSPSASGDSSSTAARGRGMACSIVGGSAAIVNKGSTTDGGERELVHPIRAQPAKSSSSKVERGLSPFVFDTLIGIAFLIFSIQEFTCLRLNGQRTCLNYEHNEGNPKISPSPPLWIEPRALMQGKRFFVGREGATLGWKNTNTIAFSYELGGTVIGIDNFISGVHARIVYDGGSGFFHVMDGSSFKV